MSTNELTGKIIGCAIQVHKTLGPGLLESIYRESLMIELISNDLIVEKEKVVPAFYNNTKLEIGLRMDLIVENRIILELKSVESIHDIHIAQTLSYLKMSGLKIGLLMNFNVLVLKSGIRRLINGY